jgi:uncharacterized Zn finger protein (UPF0148 family)
MSSSKKRTSKGIETDCILADEVSCPICNRVFVVSEIAEHVDRCLFLNSPSSSKPEPLNKDNNSSASNTSSIKQVADTGSFLLAKRAKPAENETNNAAEEASIIYFAK